MINWNLDFFEAAKVYDSSLGEMIDLGKLVYPFKLEDRHMEYLDCVVDRDVYEAIVDMDGFAAYLNPSEKGNGFEVGIMDGGGFVPYRSERYDHLLGNF